MTATLSCDAFFYSESGEDLHLNMNEISMEDDRYLVNGAYLGKGTRFYFREAYYEITSMYTRLALKKSKRENLVLNIIYVVKPVAAH